MAEEWDRRKFLQTLGGAIAAAGVGLGATELQAQQLLRYGPTIASNNFKIIDNVNYPHFPQFNAAADESWGAVPQNGWVGNSPQYKVLEIYLYGGLSPWETFYFTNGSGAACNWANMQSQLQALQWDCNGAPTSATQKRFFASDADGRNVYFGGITAPLWRNDILDATSLVALKHSFSPHEAAIPYAISGSRLGRPQMAGLGAAIAHRALARAGSQAAVVPPPACVCVPPIALTTDNLTAFDSVGLHPASARPLSIKIDAQVGNMIPRLKRAGISMQSDAVLRDLTARYRDALRWQGGNIDTRSLGFSDYTASQKTVLQAAGLHSLLDAAPITPTSSTTCADKRGHQSHLNTPAAAIDTAVYLLQNGASYAAMVDKGLRRASGGGGYDTHNSGHAADTATNLFNTLQQLASHIRKPGETDPNKLDLDRTLIILNTEFGRTPRNTTGDGRDHWPAGYVNLFIGGPVKSRRIVGSISDAGVATTAYTPTDTRAAALLAAGVHPFAPENYAMGSISQGVRGADEPETMRNLQRIFFGV